jgi:hypothetical protein
MAGRRQIVRRRAEEGVRFASRVPHSLSTSYAPTGRIASKPLASGRAWRRSLKAFQATVYPQLRADCSGCHRTQNTSGSGAQAPLHADVDVNLAHEYALTRVNFREPEESKLVVRMRVDRRNCFGETCDDAAAKMLKAVTAWRDGVADMIPAVPRGVDQATKITEPPVLAWIAADTATIPAAQREFIQNASFHTLHNAGVSAQKPTWPPAAILGLVCRIPCLSHDVSGKPTQPVRNTSRALNADVRAAADGCWYRNCVYRR